MACHPSFFALEARDLARPRRRLEQALVVPYDRIEVVTVPLVDAACADRTQTGGEAGMRVSVGIVVVAGSMLLADQAVGQGAAAGQTLLGRDPNWIAAVGQVVGAIFTAVAAAIALVTAIMAKKVAERAVLATQRQTSMAAVQELLKDYTAREMYDALRCFGRFVAHDPERKQRFGRITAYFIEHDRRLGPEAAQDADFVWAVEQLEGDKGLQAARRQIHHHYKRIWALRRIEVIPQPDLHVLTAANYGYDLWRDEVLPVTLALGLVQQERGRPSAAAEVWPLELIRWVEEAAESPVAHAG
jgi:hypothetical protein